MDPLELLITNDVLRALDLIGVFVMGVAAGGLAARLNFDLVGFAVIGIVAGLGGGLVRDLILDLGVPAAFSGPWYLTCALAGSGFAFLVNSDAWWWRRSVTTLDIVAMGLWAATGTAKSLGYGLDVLPAILLGMVSATGGGILRDVIVGRIPGVFGGGPLYATGALVTAVLTWAVVALGIDAAWVIVAVAAGSGLALIAAWRRWTLPAHSEWEVTLSASQLKSMVRRVRRAERAKVAKETGAISVVDATEDDLAEDLHHEETAEEYSRRVLGEDGPDLIPDVQEDSPVDQEIKDRVEETVDARIDEKVDQEMAEDSHEWSRRDSQGREVPNPTGH